MEWLWAGLAGALLSSVLTYYYPQLISTGVSYWRHYRGETDDIEGEWYEYHFSKQNLEPVLKSNEYRIRRTLGGRYRVDATELSPVNPGKPLKYRGHVVQERNTLVVSLKGTNYDCTWAARYREPVVTNDALTMGIGVTFDFDNQPYAGPMLLSKKRLDPQVAERHLKTSIGLDSEHRLLDLPIGRTDSRS